MTVKELIRQLKQFDPNLRVIGGVGGFDDDFEVVEAKEHIGGGEFDTVVMIREIDE